jgi:hypothetical protein
MEYPRANIVTFDAIEGFPHTAIAHQLACRQMREADDRFRVQLVNDPSLKEVFNQMLSSDGIDANQIVADPRLKSQIMTIESHLQNRLFLAVRQRRELDTTNGAMAKWISPASKDRVKTECTKELEFIVNLLEKWKSEKMRMWYNEAKAELETPFVSDKFFFKTVVAVKLNPIGSPEVLTRLYKEEEEKADSPMADRQLDSTMREGRPC